jgi:hypothetical protein
MRSMAFMFPPWSDGALRAALVGLALAVPGVFVAPIVYVRTPYNQGRQTPVEQPIQFDHRHHAGDDQIACVYCHAGAETAPYAGVPSTELCMGCHNQVWNGSPMLASIRRSYFTGRPLEWNRVHSVPDFVYFDHSIHVTRARVACAECHGDVSSQPLVLRERLFTMGWCLDCHRARTVAPPEARMTAQAVELAPRTSGNPPISKGPTRITTCTACHR